MTAHERNKVWLQGYACAVATLQRLDGGSLLTVQVQELMAFGGLKKVDCQHADVDPYDMEVLFPKKVFK